jgi:DNA (cytosine-5)-methyltransferase 1
MDLDRKTLKVASFFSGIGGFDLAFEQAGCSVVFQCEIDPFCQKVLKKHWPSIKLESDISALNSKDIPKSDVWCAGFPCQDLSLANQGKRQGIDGQRSGLFTKFGELVSHAKPKWLVIENVPGLLNSGNGKDFKYVIQTLDDIGYFVAWRVLDAKYFGTPQRRRRVYLVASYQEDSAASVLFEFGTSSEVGGQGSAKKHTASQFPRSGFQESDLFSIQHASIGRKASAGPQAKGYRNDGETYTLDSRGSADVVCAPHDGFGIRDTTGVSRELDAARMRALGNAVCVHVVRWIADRLVFVESSQRRSSQNETHASIHR